MVAPRRRAASANLKAEEAKVASEPEALVYFFKELGFPVNRIGFEAGPLSQWLHAGLTQAGFETVLLETRHVKAALSAMTVKTDRKDVGPLVAVTFKSAVDDPSRIAKSQAVGALFGLTPKKYQSGEKDITDGITRTGDEMVRTALYEAANVLLSRITRFSKLKRWGMDV